MANQSFAPDDVKIGFRDKDGNPRRLRDHWEREHRNRRPEDGPVPPKPANWKKGDKVPGRD